MAEEGAPQGSSGAGAKDPGGCSHVPSRLPQVRAEVRGVACPPQHPPAACSPALRGGMTLLTGPCSSQN